jgi:hypothetical protein
MHPLFRVPMVRSILLCHHLESAHHTPGQPHSPPLHIHPTQRFAQYSSFLKFYPTFLQDSDFVDVSIIAMAS